MFVRYRNLKDDAEPIHNYYETLVFEMIRENTADNIDSNTLTDIACIALNKLPVKYIRHNVDMAFFSSTEETLKMRESVRNAIQEAQTFVLAQDN